MIKLSVAIDVPDLKKAESFYVNALGCKKARDQGEMVVLSTDNADIYLLEKDAGSKPFKSSADVRTYERHWTPIHLDFLCGNVEEVVSNIEKYGGSREGGESGEWGSIAHCADPFGNGFCLINE